MQEELRRRLLGAVASILIACAALAHGREQPATTLSTGMIRSTSDGFDWLRESQGQRALGWVSDQRERALASVGRTPEFSEMYHQALEVLEDGDRIPTHRELMLHDGSVYHLLQSREHPRGQWRRTSVQAFRDQTYAWQTLIDLDVLSKQMNAPISFDFARCIGDRCLISLLNSTSQSIREFDLRSRAFVENGFAFPLSTGGFADWLDANSVLVATDWGADTLSRVGLPLVLKLWKRGEPMAKAREIFRARGEDAAIGVGAIRGAHPRAFVVSALEDAYSDPERSWLLTSEAKLREIAINPYATWYAAHREELILLVKQDWSVAGKTWHKGDLVSIPLREMNSTPSRVRHLMSLGPREVLSNVQVLKSGVLLSTFNNATGSATLFVSAGGQWRARPISDIPRDGSAYLTLSNPSSSIAFVSYESFLRPPTLFAVDGDTGRVTTVRTTSPKFDASRFVTEQFEAVSRDGTRIPYFVIHSTKLKKDGRSRTLLWAYGAVGSVDSPVYNGVIGRLWLERDGVYVVANVRGGSELGPDWHVVKAERRHTYEDYIAVAEDLIARGITNPRRLGIRGHSYGGLLAGVALNMRPDLFGAAVIENAVLDLYIQNAHDYTAPELGSWNVPEERAFLEQTSPYQNLTRVARLVPRLVTSSTDDSYGPSMTRPYAARCQELGASTYYFEIPEGGHAYGANPQQVATHEALVFSFLNRELESSSVTPVK